MKVRYTGESDPFGLINGKVHDVLSVEDEWYRIVDETDDDCLYPPDVFEIIDGAAPWIEPPGVGIAERFSQSERSERGSGMPA
ncbi:MAG: hypothetical protein LBS70_02725 [Candidatus Accumulibacter sp.]|jgi:hypothetical protein|nr:hypothetical protein [Accumulibacter sp.]